MEIPPWRSGASQRMHSALSIRARVLSSTTRFCFSSLLSLFAALQEEFPYQFVSAAGTTVLIEAAAASGRLLPIVPSLIAPLRNALNTRRSPVMLAAVGALHQMITSDVRAATGAGVAPAVARSLIPYLRQLLPVLNIFVTSNRNLGDGIEYGQRKGEVLGDRITEVRHHDPLCFRHRDATHTHDDSESEEQQHCAFLVLITVLPLSIMS